MGGFPSLRSDLSLAMRLGSAVYTYMIVIVRMNIQSPRIKAAVQLCREH
jgi:hypothetical protein